jgi:hypothetical protein
MYCFVPPFRKAKFCGVSGCAVGKKKLRNTAIGHVGDDYIDGRTLLDHHKKIGCVMWNVQERVKW